MSTLRVVGGSLAVVVAAWLQVAWFGHVRPLGIIPNCVLLVVILFALWSDATPALAAAIAGGLLLDLASGSDFGLHMAFYVVTVLAIIAGRQLGLHATSMITGVAITIVATILFNLMVLATIQASLSQVALSRIGRELIVNLILILLAYIVVANVGRRSQVSADLGIGASQ